MAAPTTIPRSDSLHQSTSLHQVTSEYNDSTFFDRNSSNITITGDINGCRILDTEFAFVPWDNPENIISHETAMILSKVLMGVVTPVFATAGIWFNIINSLVFWRQGFGERITMLLFCQAVSDFCVEVYVFLNACEYFYMLVKGNFQTYGPFIALMQNNGLNTLYGFIYISGFISTVIACERCLCITQPFIAKKFFKPKSAGIMTVVVACCLMGSHYFISDKFRVTCVYYRRIGVTTKGFFPSDFYVQNPKLVDIFNGVVYGLVLPSLFAILTAITTIITAVKLKTVVAWRQQTFSANEDTKKEVALTKMLIAVSILFLVCTLPNILVRMTAMIVPKFQLGGRYHNLYMRGILLMQLGPAVNSCLNFFFYVRMGSKYRLTLKQMCCWFQKNTIDNSSKAPTSASA